MRRKYISILILVGFTCNCHNTLNEPNLQSTNQYDLTAAHASLMNFIAYVNKPDSINFIKAYNSLPNYWVCIDSLGADSLLIQQFYDKFESFESMLEAKDINAFRMACRLFSIVTPSDELAVYVGQLSEQYPEVYLEELNKNREILNPFCTLCNFILDDTDEVRFKQQKDEICTRRIKAIETVTRQDLLAAKKECLELLHSFCGIR